MRSVRPLTPTQNLSMLATIRLFSYFYSQILQGQIRRRPLCKYVELFPFNLLVMKKNVAGLADKQPQVV